MENNLGKYLGSCQTDSLPLLANIAIHLGWLQHRYARYYVSCLDLYEQGILLRARRAGGQDRSYRWNDIRRIWLERIPNAEYGEAIRIDVIAPNLDVIFSLTLTDSNQPEAKILQQIYDRWHQATWRHFHVVAAVVSDQQFAPEGAEPRYLCMQKPDTRYAYTSRHWEFPGGKVEAGETEPQALQRELREEMDYEVQVVQHLTTVEHNYADFGITLSCWLCTAPTNKFVRKEHIDHRWLTAQEMRELDWCAADAPVLDILSKEN